MEAKEGKRVILGRARHLILCNIEFFIRAYVTGVILVILNQLFLFNITKAVVMFLGHAPYTLTNSETKLIALPWLVMVYIARGAQQYISFEEELKGLHCDGSSEKAKPFKGVLILLTLCSCILNCLLFWYSMAPVFLCLYGCYSIIVLIYFIWNLWYLNKYKVYWFTAWAPDSNPDEKLVRLGIDISILLKQGREVQVNLLKSNLYICENDDLLIVPHNDTAPQLYHKEFIKCIKIKGVQLIYDGDKWEKLSSGILI